MKKKISNRAILEKSVLLSQISEKRLTVKVSYSIGKNISKLESLLKLYNKEREKLIDRYAEKDKDGKLKVAADGNSIKFKDDNAANGWKNDIEDLLDIENEVEVRSIPLSSIEELDEIRKQHPELKYDTLTPKETGTIDFMIEE